LIVLAVKRTKLVPTLWKKADEARKMPTLLDIKREMLLDWAKERKRNRRPARERRRK